MLYCIKHWKKSLKLTCTVCYNPPRCAYTPRTFNTNLSCRAALSSEYSSLRNVLSLFLDTGPGGRCSWSLPWPGIYETRDCLEVCLCSFYRSEGTVDWFGSVQGGEGIRCLQAIFRGPLPPTYTAGDTQ